MIRYKEEYKLIRTKKIEISEKKNVENDLSLQLSIYDNFNDQYWFI